MSDGQIFGMTDFGSDSLTKTKLHRPRPIRGLLARPRLVHSLDNSQTLTLLLAPAGYGKTTLLSTWLEGSDLPSAWLSLDERDNDLVVFSSYLASAVHTVFRGLLHNVVRVTSGLTEPTPDLLIRTIVNGLDAVTRPFVLVLDDYHTIHNPAIHTLMTEIIQQSPWGLLLVISSRHDPPLPLARLHARFDVLELRAADLQFTEDEAAHFLQSTVSGTLDDHTLSSIIAGLEGWPAGLRLAALALRDTESLSRMAAVSPTGNPLIAQYFIDEVLQQLPQAIQECLLKMSLFENLSRPLCETVVGVESVNIDGQPILEWLSHNGAFVVASDEQGHWFRLHNLFRRLLQTRLHSAYTTSEIADLHARASAWYEANGYLDEALDHALQAGGSGAALRVVARHRHELMNQAERHRLERWTNLFPDMVIQNQPTLLLNLIWLKFIDQRFAEARHLLDRVDDLLDKHPDDNRKSLLGEAAARRCQVCYWLGEFDRAIEAAESALHHIPVEWWYIRATARFFLGLSYQCLGHLSRAFSALNPNDELLPPESYRTLLTGMQTFLYWAEADFGELAHAASYLFSREERVQESELTAWGRFFVGFVHYQRNELQIAEDYLMSLLSTSYPYHPAAVMNSAAVMVKIRMAQHQIEEAQQVVDAMQGFAVSLHSTALQIAGAALHAYLAMRCGRLAEAGQWAEQNASFSRIPAPFPFSAPVVAVSILLEQDTSATRQSARQLLAEMADYFTSIHNRSRRVEILALQAILEWNEGNESAALDALEESVNLAEPSSAARLFVDLSLRLEPLLKKLFQRGQSLSYLSEVLAAFNTKETPPAVPSQPPSIQNAILLTYREQEVLALLADRCSDKEIADSLVISTETVRTHINHLFQKLHVHGRRALVQAAKDRGLLS